MELQDVQRVLQNHPRTPFGRRLSSVHTRRTHTKTDQPESNLRIPQTRVCGVITMRVLKCMMSQEHLASHHDTTPSADKKGEQTFFMHLANMLETPDWLFISGPAEVIISSSGLNWLSVYVRPQGPVNFLESLFGIGQSVHMCPFPLMHITWGHKLPSKPENKQCKVTHYSRQQFIRTGHSVGYRRPRLASCTLCQIYRICLPPSDFWQKFKPA